MDLEIFTATLNETIEANRKAIESLRLEESIRDEASDWNDDGMFKSPKHVREFVEGKIKSSARQIGQTNW